LEGTLIVRTKPANYTLAEQGHSTSITNVMGIKTEQSNSFTSCSSAEQLWSQWFPTK
jgi:hypothetical protein